VGGEVVRRSGVTSRLALTGTDGTRPYVLVGLCAVSLGIVLVVAARRRNRVQGRA
jgi:LPXTG-motif cell wall-anchored protein